MKKILVIGEACQDIFCYGHTERLCPEAPAPVFNPIDKVQSSGMAMNVQRNVISLGLECDIITNENWRDVVKTRYIHKNTNQMFIRIDVNDDQIERCDLTNIDFKRYDAVIISDYCKGYLAEEDIAHVGANHDCVFLDTKRVLGPWCENITFIKINQYEYEKTKPTITDKIRDRLIITYGNRGCEYQGRLFEVEKVDIKDVTGAGDTFMAALATEYATSQDVEKAIIRANECATLVVQKRGVSVPT